MSGTDGPRPEDWLDGYGRLDPDGRFVEFQRLGLDAASSIMARFAEFWDVAPGDREPDPGPFGARPAGPGEPSPSGDPLHDARAEAARGLDAVLDMTRKLFESTLDLADAALRRPHLGTWLADGAVHEAGITVEAVPGATSSGSAWLHHRGDRSGPVRFDAVAPRAAGRDAPAGTVTVEPATLDPLADGDRVELSVSVTVDPATPPGTYHGLLLADGLPDAALAVRLVVRPGTGAEAS
jgi:hypothetical protein